MNRISRSFRLKKETIDKIEELAKELGLNNTSVIGVAINEYYRSNGGK